MVCSFGWDKFVEMKDHRTEFWTMDGSSRLKIAELDEKGRNIFFICIQTGKITWPLSFRKLEAVHEKVMSGKIGLAAFEIERALPTWGNYITGLLSFLGCQKHAASTEVGEKAGVSGPAYGISGKRPG
jgi:hypothetical protein